MVFKESINTSIPTTTANTHHQVIRDTTVNSQKKENRYNTHLLYIAGSFV